MSKVIPLATVLLLLSLFSNAQNTAKRTLTHSDYYLWKTLSGQSISNDGRWVCYETNLLKGNGWLHYHNLTTGKHDSIFRGQGGVFDASSKLLVYTIKPREDTLHKLKLAKKKKEDLPKDSLGILLLSNDSLMKFPGLKSFSIPKEGSSWVAFLSDKPKKEEKKNTTADSTQKLKVSDTSLKTPVKKESKKEPAKKKKGAFSETETYQLTLMNPVLKETFIYNDVVETAWSKNGALLSFISLKKDSVDSTAVNVFNTGSKLMTRLFYRNGLAKKPAVDNSGTQLACLFTGDTCKVKRYSLQLWNNKITSLQKIADTATAGIPAGWEISENGSLAFSDDGSKLYIRTAPKVLPQPKDTLLDEEKVRLDLWHWQDGRLQSQQVKDLDKDLKQSYQAVYRISEKRIVQLGDTILEQIRLQQKGNADFGLGVADRQYQLTSSWDGARYRDYYLLDLKTGSRKLLMKKYPGNADLSPDGRYFLYYNESDSSWNSRNILSGKSFNLTKTVPVEFCDEENDVPANPNEYGIGGWFDNDASVLVYDRYDIWQFDPENRKPPVNLTKGRASKTTYRYVKLDPEALSINPADPLLLKVAEEETCRQGFASILINNAPTPNSLIINECEYSQPVKAKNSNRLIWQRSTYTEYPDLWTSNPGFTDALKLSAVNPQQNNYWWGTVEPVKWKSFDGTSLKGLIYKPENYDPAHKYPLIVYYYEKNSNKRYSYSAPTPSRSIVNCPLYNSNGYIVFVPDIVYKTGFPGNSAYEAIMSGTLEMMKQYPSIDGNRMGLQGQSWGGYQTAYMVTRTNMFKAAMAGAAVSNMTSAYGGIRWESGVVREFQYEHGQSRIGGTLWNNRDLYIENSPVFYADRINTPLLLMNNDNDGAVPWYQGIEFFTALRRLGKPAWMLTYNGEEHNLTKLPNRQDLSIRMMQFFDYYLKGTPMPVWMKEGIPATVKGRELRYELSD